jgi:hypothetical protein
MNVRSAVALCLALAVACGPTLAQQARPSGKIDPKACAPDEHMHPKPVPGAPATTGTGQSLSDKLARTDGVLCPPPVDPGMVSPPPAGGALEIIPPPGSPGGDPAVRPK